MRYRPRKSPGAAPRTTASSRWPRACAMPRWQRAVDPMSAAPLANIRVLDFTHYLAGPFGTFQLALQGADVIKVEPRGGDTGRISSVSQEWGERGMGPFWMAINAGKRSITLDVTKPDGKAIVHRLVQDV